MVIDPIDLGLSPETAVTAPRFGTAHHLSPSGKRRQGSGACSSI